MESTNKNIQKLNKFIELINVNLEDGEFIDKESLRRDLCIKLIEENKIFFSQIAKEEAFYFFNNLRLADYKKNRTKVASKIILNNQNFLPINSNQDLVDMLMGFRLFKDGYKLNLIELLVKSRKTDFFKNIDLGDFCQLLMSDLKITSNVTKVRLLEVADNQNPNLFANVASPIALLTLFEELRIDLDLEKHKLTEIILNKQKNIFSNVRDVYDVCSMIPDFFMISSDSIKYMFFKTITESNPNISMQQVDSIDNFLRVMQNLRMGQNANAICKICDLLISDKPEIIGSVTNIERVIQQADLSSNREKYELIKKAVSLQTNKEDRAKLVKDAFKEFVFLSYQPDIGADLIKECVKDFNINESANLINEVVAEQGSWSKGELLFGIIFANIVRDKELFLKIDLSAINNQDSRKIIDIARFRVKLTDFDLLKFSKLINCDKYSSIRDLLEKTGANGIFKSSIINFIKEAFNPDNDNDFDINKCKAINFLNYAQLMGIDVNLHKIFKSNYFKELGRSFVARAEEMPASSMDLMQITKALKIRASDYFIPLSNITTIFQPIKNQINNVKIEDVASLSISQNAKEILEQIFQSPNNLTIEKSTEFFRELLDPENSLDFSGDNRAKLFFFLRRNHKDLCALLKSPEGVANLNNAVYSIADGCIANIGNQMKMLVLQELIKNQGGKNSYAMLKVYQGLIEGSVVPLINSQSDFIGPDEDIIASSQYMEFYHTTPTDFFKHVASKFKGSGDVYNFLSTEMGADNATKLMIKSGVCDEDLTEFDEEKANLLGAYKAITGVFKKKEVKKFFTNSDTEVKALFATIKDAEKSIAESEQTPANNIAPLAGLRNLGASAVNFFQRFANR